MLAPQLSFGEARWWARQGQGYGQGAGAGARERVGEGGRDIATAAPNDVDDGRASPPPTCRCRRDYEVLRFCGGRAGGVEGGEGGGGEGARGRGGEGVRVESFRRDLGFAHSVPLLCKNPGGFVRMRGLTRDILPLRLTKTRGRIFHKNRKESERKRENRNTALTNKLRI